MPVPPLRDFSEPIPTFTHDDLPWIDDAFVGAAADLDKYRADVSAGANPIYAARLPFAEAAMDEAVSRFGLDAGRFLDAMNAGELWADFWRAMFCLFGLKAQRPVRIDGETQARILSLLQKLPRHMRRAILAQAFFPAKYKPRKWEGLHALVQQELEAEGTDLRTWEVGAGKVAALEDMDDLTLFEIARSFGARTGQFTAFKRHAYDTASAKPVYRSKSETPPGEFPTDRSEALAILENVPVANRYGPGRLVKSEVNLTMTQSFHATMLKSKPGIPHGHLMHLALSTKPAGPSWPNVDFGAFSKDFVWPYVASHLDIVLRALAGQRLPWEPMMEPHKALQTLALLPKLPVSVVSSVEGLSTDGAAAQKKAAKALL